MKIIDLTHTFTEEMPVFPGDPAATIKQTASIEAQGYNDHELKTYMHVGTHMDAPLHMIANGKSIDELDPQYFFGKGLVIDARGKERIDLDLLENIQIPEQAIVLLYTEQSSRYRTKAYDEGYPAITESFAQRMVEQKVKILGMDMLGPDQPPYPTHKILLGSGTLIIENLVNLDQLLEVKDFNIVALPVKLKSDAAPVRIVALVKE